MPGRVIVVGSVNVDLVASVDRLPAPGETVTGGTFARHPGGKGGNQATAAARLGAPVLFVGAVGNDPLAAEARASLAAEGIDVGGLTAADAPTGVALILVDAAGENLIAVASGANATVTPEAVADRLARDAPVPGDVVVACNEIPSDAVLVALQAGRSRGATTVLNPAPAAGLQREHLDVTDVLVPNRGELASLTATGDSASRSAADDDAVVEMARSLLGSAGADSRVGVGAAVIVTLGSRGAVVVRGDREPFWIDSPPVTAVDTVGAGDTFVGALAAALAEGRTLDDAARRAVVAASLSTTKRGARGGMPAAPDLEAAIRSL